MAFTYKYPRPMVTVDTVIIRVGEPRQILLIQRKNAPFKDHWAFPGGFIEMDETLENAAKRELKEETGLIIDHLIQFKTLGNPNRDPRGRTISVIYIGFVADLKQVVAADDARQARWFLLNELPQLAFDHDEIIRSIIKDLPVLHQLYHTENRYKENV